MCTECSRRICYSSLERRLCICWWGGGSWGGATGRETRKWAGTQPKGPLMYKNDFGLFLKGEECLKGFLQRNVQVKSGFRMALLWSENAGYRHSISGLLFSSCICLL